MITVIRVFILILSTIGWWELIREKTHINIYFIPSLTIAIQVIILFFSGLLNLLPEGAFILFFLGLIMLFRVVASKRMIVPLIRQYSTEGFLFLGIAMLIMSLFLRGKLFTHYDNFSHWALVVRRMLEINRFPNYSDTIIEFQEYPLGSAIFIYFWGKIAGASEPMQMSAQVYMMLSCIMPLFSLLEKNKRFGTLLILFATNFFVTYNIAPTDLLVDSLLPLAGMCGSLFAFFYCRENTDASKLFCASSYMIWLVQLKNSGLFFAMIICLLVFKNTTRNLARSRIACLGAPIFSLILWHKHCDYVFDAARQSKHALTVSNCVDVFFRKTWEEVFTISKAMLKFSIMWRDIWLVLGMFVVLGIIVFLFANSQMTQFKTLLIVSILLYVVYQIGELGMFLFSMPKKEALILLGNLRYSKTIIIAIIYMYTGFSLHIISSFDKHQIVPLSSYSLGLSIFYCCFLVLSTGQLRFAMNFTGSYSAEERQWIESVAAEYGVPLRKTYCILIPEPDSMYAFYLGKYIFQSEYISTLVIDEPKKMEKIKGEYIFVYDKDNEIITSWVADNYPDQQGSEVIILKKNN